MRDAAGRDPPVPPGIVKRRQRWSLGLLGRKKSNRESKKADAPNATSSGNDGNVTAPSSAVSDEQGPERHSDGLAEDKMLTTADLGEAVEVVSEAT